MKHNHYLNKYIRISLLIFLLLTGTVSYGQVRDTICGTDELRRSRPTLFKDGTTPIESTGISTQKAATDVMYTIPVLFVVYHTGEAVGTGSNVSDQQIQEALDDMNRAFSGTYANGIDANIRFVLAKRLPNCTATNGIYRVNASGFPNYTTQGITSYQNAFDLAQAYPPFQFTGSRDFVTIRIVRDLTFAAGFAQMNGGTIFLDRGTVGLGTFTLAHEMGHVFSLYHTFEGSTADNPICPLNTNPTVDGDRVSDTDPHRYGDFTCTASATNTCTGQPFGLLTTNLMNYACGRIFSQGQIDRMRSFLASQPSLTTSVFGQPVTAGDAVVSANCSVSLGYPPTDYINGISRVRFNTLDFLSEPYPTGNIAGNYNDFTCGRRTSVQPGVTYPLSLTAYSARRKVYIDYNNDGNFNETNELVFNTASGASSTNITIPTTAVTGSYLRMRVVVDEGSIPPTACYLPGDPVFGCGEIEDYGVLIESACSPLYTLKVGNWNDSTVWSCNRVPAATDAVTINHNVTVPANYTANALRLTYANGGRIIYNLGGILRLGP